VTNYNDLLADEARLAALYAEIDAVISAINAITPTADLSVFDEENVIAARALYDALTLEQRALVTNYQTLLDGEAKLALLKQSIIDLAAANVVDEMIYDFPLLAEITLANEADVVAARNAYNALTETQKALVTGLSDLEAAELLIIQLV
jgi:hypothetical protein